MDELDAIEAEFGTPTPSEEQLGSLEQTVNKAMTLTEQIQELEEIIAEMKGKLHEYLERDIPALMMEAGCSKFETTDGLKVEVRDIVAGSLPKDPELRTKALRWLEAIGAADIIKAKLGVSLPRGSKEDQDAVRKFFLDHGFDFEDQEAVHPQTLAAFARERAKAGDEVPYEMLGLYHGKKANIIESKKDK